MNTLCVVLMLMWFSNGLVTSSAIPINVEAGISLKFEGAHLDTFKSKNATIRLQMALELSSGDLRTPALIENIEDSSIAVTPTPQPTTTTTTETTTTKGPNTRKECPLGFIKLGSHCYYFSQTKETWHDALRSCMNLDADLVHPMSEEENSLITTHLINNHKDDMRWWIGGTDEYEEGNWVWAHDKSPMTYTDWSGGEITNYNSYNCAYYPQKLDYKWFDSLCANDFQYICQQRDLDEDIQQQ